LIAKWSESFTDEFFVLEWPVHFSGVKQSNARLDSRRINAIASCLSVAGP
jgi:hypothetical protein